MSGWQHTTLGALCRFVGGQGFPPEYQGLSHGDVPFIKVSDMELPPNGRRITTANNWLTGESLAAGRFKPQPSGAIVFAKIGEAIKRERVRVLTRPTVIDNNMMAAIPEAVDSEFLFNLLRFIPFSKDHGGTSLPYLRQGDLAKIEAFVPPLEEQERIAGVLGAFDDLIETNRRLAGKMRAGAQHVARRALIGRERTVALTDVATVDKGFSYKSAELDGDEMVLLNLKNAGRGGHFRRDGYKPLSTSRHKPGHVVQAGDVIVAMTDLTQDRDIIARPLRVQAPAAQVKMVASLDIAVLRPRNGSTREFIWAVLSDPSFRSHALGYCSGTTVLHMKGTAFGDYLVPEVDERLIAHLSEAVEPLISGADEVDLEADALTAQRDELLPLLMSGKVRVREVEAAVS